MCNLSERIKDNTKEKIVINLIRQNIPDQVIYEATEVPLSRIAELREKEMCLV